MKDDAIVDTVKNKSALVDCNKNKKGFMAHHSIKKS